MDVAAALGRITETLPSAETRPGQLAMAEAVGAVLEAGGVLLVEAGTGTGKSLGYLVPALLSVRRPVVVATATKALQDQLLGKDIPSLTAGVGRPVTAAMLKGRASYLCRAKEAEWRDRLDPSPAITRLLAWAEATETGDRSEVEPAPSPADWAELSVNSEECPGAQKCSFGEVCLSEMARTKAEMAELVVVNHALLAVDLALRAGSEGEAGVLPDPAAIVVDEAHRFEESLSSALGVDLGQGRVRYAARLARGLLTETRAPDELEAAAEGFFGELARFAGRRVDDELRHEIAQDAVRLSQAISQLHAQTKPVPDSAAEKKLRLQGVLSSLALDLHFALEDDDSRVAWVEADRDAGRLRVAPLEVREFASTGLFDRAPEVPVVLTSATLTFAGSFDHLRSRLGVSAATELTVDSPFDYRQQGLLYVARHLPDPRSPTFDEAAHDETRRLLGASRGRTFCLYTSWRAMEAAYSALAPGLPWTVLKQGEAGPARLVERMVAEAPAVLFATVSFWQGVDVPGEALSLVVLDKLPFASPGDPLAAARVEAVRQAGGDWFADEVLPRAGLLLAQGVGRLIRRVTDRGVVAVLDRRLATAGYRAGLLQSVPPLRRTVTFADVEAFFSEVGTDSGGPDSQ